MIIVVARHYGTNTGWLTNKSCRRERRRQNPSPSRFESIVPIIGRALSHWYSHPPTRDFQTRFHTPFYIEVAKHISHEADCFIYQPLVSARCSMVQQLSTNGLWSWLCKAPTRQGTRRATSNLCMEWKHSRKYCLCAIMTLLSISDDLSAFRPAFTQVNWECLIFAQSCKQTTHSNLTDTYFLFDLHSLIKLGDDKESIVSNPEKGYVWQIVCMVFLSFRNGLILR